MEIAEVVWRNGRERKVVGPKCQQRGIRGSWPSLILVLSFPAQPPAKTTSKEGRAVDRHQLLAAWLKTEKNWGAQGIWAYATAVVEIAPNLE